MTAVPAPVPAPVSTPGHPARFRDLLAAEWLKFRSLRSTCLLLALSALAVVAVSLKAATYTCANSSPGAPRSAVAQVALDDSFGTLAITLVMITAGSIGALVMAGEFASGSIRGTLAAVPARRSVLAAKACVLAAAMSGYGACCAGVSYGLAQAVLSGHRAAVGLDYPGALRFVVAAALFAPVCALAGLGLGTLVRHPAGAVAATVLVLFLLPSLCSDRYAWSAALSHLMPLTALHRLLELDPAHFAPSPHPASVGGAWLAFALWAAGGTALGAALLHRRDV
ncbi:ABC transporter permease subunit [Kitasatospora sp. NPDC006697]|uniref:ABC transporter permease subunit n=1 Tax=Kitasatospora sp. NPDC006697 TaxID=3364020 RepID=UPI0036BAB746